MYDIIVRCIKDCEDFNLCEGEIYNATVHQNSHGDTVITVSNGTHCTWEWFKEYFELYHN